MVVEPVRARPRKTAAVIIKYSRKAIKLREGENCIIISIQPKCAMEE